MIPYSHIAGLIKFIQGSGVSVGGISPLPLPDQPTLPYLTIHQIANIDQLNLEGSSGLTRSIIQVNFWDKSYESADLMRRTIKGVLLDHDENIGDIDIIGPVSHIIDTEFYDGVRKLHQLISRFEFWFDDQPVTM